MIDGKVNHSRQMVCAAKSARGEVSVCVCVCACISRRSCPLKL